MTIGSRLKEARKFLNYSQEAMAEAANSGFSSWQSYEKNRNTPGVKVLANLADMGFNINYILTGKGTLRIEAMHEQRLEIKRMRVELAKCHIDQVMIDIKNTLAILEVL